MNIDRGSGNRVPPYLMDRSSSRTGLWLRLKALWVVYFVKPAENSEAYTRWSRNFLNIGLFAAIASIFFVPMPSVVRFAYFGTPNLSDKSIRTVEGIYRGMSTQRSVDYCIFPKPESRVPLACYSPNSGMPVRPDLQGQPGFALLVDNQILQVTVNGIGVVSYPDAVRSAQTYLKRFATLFGIFVTFSSIAIFRQYRLVRKDPNVAV